MASETHTGFSGRIAGVFGGVSGGVGAFGALHNVCHYTCQILVAGLAVAGVSLTGLPLAFLEEPKLVTLFAGMGVLSLGVSTTLHLKGKAPAVGTSRLRAALDRRTAVLLALLLLSGWSLTQGAAQILRGSVAAAESATRTSKQGSVEVELTWLNLTDPSLKDGVVFELTMNSMDMGASSFQGLDLKQAITLETEAGVAVHPAEVRIAEWGHMGHHVRGRLLFPPSVAGAAILKSRVVRLTVRGIGGVEKRVLEWRVPTNRG